MNLPNAPENHANIVETGLLDGWRPRNPVDCPAKRQAQVLIVIRPNQDAVPERSITVKEIASPCTKL